MRIGGPLCAIYCGVPYRHTLENSTCIVCSASVAEACRNCSTRHCEAHLLDGRCAGCEGALWAMERREVARALGAYSLLAVLAAAAGSVVIAPVLAVVVPLVAVVAGFGLSRFTRPAARRRLEDTRLRPSSVPMLSAASYDCVSEETTMRPRPQKGLRASPRPSATRRSPGSGYIFG
jgi:hypothetical protein